MRIDSATERKIAWRKYRRVWVGEEVGCSREMMDANQGWGLGAVQ
jgi:hypothetical protein